MTRRSLPSRDDVLTALAQLRADAAATGRQPAALSLARRLGLSNTTFRRNFPDIATQLSQQAAERRQMPQQPSRYAELKEASEQLRHDNRVLRVSGMALLIADASTIRGEAHHNET